MFTQKVAPFIKNQINFVHMLGIRPFATKGFKQDKYTHEPLSNHFNFPNHKELFADHYYDTQE